MRLRFTKMQGAGNDFVVLDGVRQPVSLTPAQWRWLADRHFGVGADQILLVEPAASPDNDFRYRIFNADGGEVEQCGNGARCFVRFVRDQGLSAKDRIRVETQAGVIEPALEPDGRVTVDMGAPVFEPARVPFVPPATPARREGEAPLWVLPAADPRLAWAVVSMGNPHAVCEVDDVDAVDVAAIGRAVQADAAFPAGVNVGFLQRVDASRVRLRVFERGVGETLACGTGACAAVVAGVRRGRLASPVVVHTRGGDLSIAWTGGTVRMTGPAETVFSGELELPELA